jgi:hypothetical protein
LSAPQRETLTNNSGLLNHHSSIMHPLLYLLLLLFDDMLYCVRPQGRSRCSLKMVQ